MVKFWVAVASLLSASSAYAYIDPVTFNSIYQFLLILILTPLLFLKTFVHWIGLLYQKVRQLFGKK